MSDWLASTCMRQLIWNKVIKNSPVADMLAGIGKAKQANVPMSHGIGKLWAIFKTFGPLW